MGEDDLKLRLREEKEAERKLGRARTSSCASLFIVSCQTSKIAEKD